MSYYSQLKKNRYCPRLCAICTTLIPIVCRLPHSVQITSIPFKFFVFC
uniref:Uncharacterized protein n=1 Tax=Arundo donax TaxID=35708 RepID=A0A0A9FLZ1_ARUDO